MRGSAPRPGGGNNFPPPLVSVRPEVLEKVLYTNACRLYGFTK